MPVWEWYTNWWLYFFLEIHSPHYNLEIKFLKQLSYIAGLYFTFGHKLVFNVYPLVSRSKINVYGIRNIKFTNLMSLRLQVTAATKF